MFKNFILMFLVSAFTISCGPQVEVPPAHVGKLSTESGLQEGLIRPSKFRWRLQYKRVIEKAGEICGILRVS